MTTKNPSIEQYTLPDEKCQICGHWRSQVEGKTFEEVDELYGYNAAGSHTHTFQAPAPKCFCKAHPCFHDMTPEDQEAQRQSWVRGEMALTEHERGMTLLGVSAPKCPKCGKQQSAVRTLFTGDIRLCIFCWAPLAERRHHERRQGERRTRDPLTNHRSSCPEQDEDGAYCGICLTRSGRDRRTADRRKARTAEERKG